MYHWSNESLNCITKVSCLFAFANYWRILHHMQLDSFIPYINALCVSVIFHHKLPCHRWRKSFGCKMIQQHWFSSLWQAIDWSPSAWFHHIAATTTLLYVWGKNSIKKTKLRQEIEASGIKMASSLVRTQLEIFLSFLFLFCTLILYW